MDDSPRSRNDTASQIQVPEAMLIRWNAALCVFHTGLAILTLAVGKWDLRADVYRTTLDVRYENQTERSGAWELVPVLVSGGDFNATWLTASFFMLSAVFHLLNATCARDYYLSQLRQCYTPLRWIEYFFSASVMIILISYFLGVRDRVTLVSNAVLVAVTMTFGYWTEREARPASPDAWTQPLSVRLFPWVLGHVPQSAAWAVIIHQFYTGFDATDDVPWFVHLILWGELALFFSFGIAALVSQLNPPRFFYQGEVLFQMLSLVSKGLLGGLLITNVLMLSNVDDVYD